MQIYPYRAPIILNDAVYSLYGGQGTGTFPSAVLQSSYLLAEMQVTNYIGTFLLPTILTGTFPFMHQSRIITDYGYVSQLLNVNVLTKTACNSCTLTNNDACGYIYEGTFGYIDFRRLAMTCGWSWWGYPYSPYILAEAPYQIEIAYVAGLPTGTATQPGILEAITILASVDLNEKFPGAVGINESVGAVGIQEFKSMDYWEKRAEHALVKTALGDDARSQRAKKLIDMSVRKARRVLFA
jgi:hypothetical protein